MSQESSDRGGADGGRLRGWWDRLRGRPSTRNTRPARYIARLPQRPAPDPIYGRRTTYGRQARRQADFIPYLIAFGLMVATLGAFVYLGLNWVTGAGRESGLATALAPPPSPSPSPDTAALPLGSPTPLPEPARARTYVVRPGDNPASIAEEFGVTAEALMELNNITDPSKLQVGQALTIPTPGPARGR